MMIIIFLVNSHELRNGQGKETINTTTFAIVFLVIFMILLLVCQASNEAP